MSDDVDALEAQAVEHDLGGVATLLMGAETLATPEHARFTVDTLTGDDEDARVTVRLESERMTARVMLTPAQARELGDRLATAADE